jgi:hypothetical protein
MLLQVPVALSPVIGQPNSAIRRRPHNAAPELWPVKSLSPMLLGLFADRFGPALGHLVEMPPDLLLSATKSPKTLLDLLNAR